VLTDLAPLDGVAVKGRVDSSDGLALGAGDREVEALTHPGACAEGGSRAGRGREGIGVEPKRPVFYPEHLSACRAREEPVALRLLEGAAGEKRGGVGGRMRREELGGAEACMCEEGWL
jgi:hypothetical protein